MKNLGKSTGKPEIPVLFFEIYFDPKVIPIYEG